MFKIGPAYDCCIKNLKLRATDIVWHRGIKHLGVNFCPGKNLRVDLSGRMRKYYAAVNSIISHTKERQWYFETKPIRDVCITYP